MKDNTLEKYLGSVVRLFGIWLFVIMAQSPAWDMSVILLMTLGSITYFVGSYIK